MVRESGDRVRECARIDCTQEKSSVVFRDGDIGGVGAVVALILWCPSKSLVSHRSCINLLKICMHDVAALSTNTLHVSSHPTINHAREDECLPISGALCFDMAREYRLGRWGN